MKGEFLHKIDIEQLSKKTLFGIDAGNVQKSSATDETHLSQAIQELQIIFTNKSLFAKIKVYLQNKVKCKQKFYKKKA